MIVRLFEQRRTLSLAKGWNCSTRQYRTWHTNTANAYVAQDHKKYKIPGTNDVELLIAELRVQRQQGGVHQCSLIRVVIDATAFFLGTINNSSGSVCDCNKYDSCSVRSAGLTGEC